MAALRSRSVLGPALCLAGALAVLLACCGPTFASPSPARTMAAVPAATVAPAAALLAAPLAAEAADGLPVPVLGLGMISVIVVIVLLIAGIAIGRGLVETIDDL
mmetsp:Transcript_16927/g.22788  ORF Transcript_16927/g.22788 Transcript_16927/m.22788 type:complete len:104 (-) Transcript_16927:66-377(-)